MDGMWQTTAGRVLLVLTTVTVSLLIGAGVSRWLGNGGGSGQAIATTSSVTAAPEGAFRAAEQLQEAFSWVAKAVEPVTVTIMAPATERTTRLRPFNPPLPGPFEDDPFFREFFRRFFGREAPEERGEEGEETTPRWVPRGSGVIFRSDGYILTNRHVVEGLKNITVMLWNGRRLAATVVGSDDQTDLAVLKVDPAGDALPSARFGDSDQVRVGDWAIAIGNPFGFRQTLTVGVVSALGRNPGTLAAVQYTDFIQTDAAINQGNSGGPLCNIRGEVIGINTAIFSPSGGSVGIGFAIPINTAKFVADQILTKGKVTRGWLGVRIMDAEAVDDPASLGLKDVHGAVVVSVLPGSPAEKGGLQPKDVVVAFNGLPVRNSAHLQTLIGRTPPGQTVTLTVLRSGKERTLSVTLEERREEVVALAKQEFQWRGLTVGDLTPEVRKSLNVPSSVQGVVVKEVDAESPSGMMGVEPGDIITALSSQPVRNLSDFIRMTRSLSPGQTVAVTVRRGSSTMMKMIPAQ